MALRRKPQSESKRSPADEHHIEALINKGGSVAPDHKEGGEGRPQLVQLRLPRVLVQRIDKARKHRLVVPSRHTWLLEALLEKLETEERLKASGKLEALRRT